MPYEVLLLMNRMKAEQERRERIVRIGKDTRYGDIDYANVEEVTVSAPCPIPDLEMFPRLKRLVVSTLLDACDICNANFGDLESLSLNVKPFSGRLKINGSKLKSLRVYVNPVDERLPLIDGNETGIIDLCGLSSLLDLSLHHVSCYTINLPTIPGLKRIRVANSHQISLSPVINNPQITHLELVDCDIEETSFLEHFWNLEKLDLSWNRIREVPEILKKTGLKDLCLWRNQLSDPDEYRLPQLERKIITERDARIDSFSSTIKGAPYSAYRMIERVKDPKKVAPFIYKHYKDLSDEEVFTDYLVMGIAGSAIYYENADNLRNVTLTRQETDCVIMKQYPYLIDRIRSYREKRLAGS